MFHLLRSIEAGARYEEELAALRDAQDGNKDKKSSELKALERANKNLKVEKDLMSKVTTEQAANICSCGTRDFEFANEA